MSGEDRTEWPTRAHLDELRSQGVIFSSPAAIRSAFGAGFMAGVVLLGSDFLKSASAFFVSSPARLSPESLKQACLSLLNETFGLLVIPVLIGLCLAIFTGLLQTRFFFDMSRISFSTGRLLPFGPGRKPRRRGLIALFLLAPLILTLGVVFLWLLSPDLIHLLNVGKKQAASSITVFLGGAGSRAAALASLVLLSGWLAGWVVFMHSHRMTRKEVEAESREQG